MWKAQEEAFNMLKEDLAGASILAYVDRGACTQVITDASPVGLGAVLVQEVDEPLLAVRAQQVSTGLTINLSHYSRC